MTWDVRKTYYYLVCFATLVMMIIGAVQTVRNTLDLALPAEPHRPTALDVVERYRQPPQSNADTLSLTREELEQMANEEAARFRREQRRRDLRDLLGSLALVLIAAPVYVYHWRKVRHEG